MKTLLTIFLVFTLSVNVALCQKSLQDSVKLLYSSYFDLMKPKGKLDSITVNVKTLGDNYSNLSSSVNTELKRITDKELFNLETQYKIRKNKIIHTSDFVFASNTSLNAIELADILTKYFSEIASLNSPTDSTLGFSLSTKLSDIIKQKIIKGKNQINGGKTDKFVNIADNIIKSPIVEAASSAIPIVNSIKSVVDLVMSAATRGKDIEVSDIVAFKTDLRKYLEYYEGLAKAQEDFSKKINNIDNRKGALILLLTTYTKERSLALHLVSITQSDEQLKLTDFINKYYTKTDVESKIKNIEDETPNQFSSFLKNPKLTYPDYALNQAKFMRDEIDALSKEYKSAYRSYQTSLENILEKSLTLGISKQDLVRKKIDTLKKLLLEVEGKFDSAVNINHLNSKFKTLSEN